jgi:pteridine reductase
MGRPRKGYAAYTASKAALAGMTHALALELAPHVTVNAIAPGVVAWAPDMSQRQREAYLQRVPLGRAGTVEDAARAVVYLARDGDYLTGQTIRVDGGRWLG